MVSLERLEDKSLKKVSSFLCSDDPGGSNGMGELVDGEWRECHIQEGGHLEAHGVGIKFLPYRILHPGVGYENPPG